ncbi:MAG TPA: hypothetical protein VF111_07225 [Thermoanaerobaculia bacterium]
MTGSSRRFRASSRFELKRLDELPPEQRGAFRELESDADFYGLLVPRPPTMLSIKSVAHETASLLRTLATPAAIDADDDIIDLVLDGVLEIEAERGFVAGVDAFPILFPEARRTDGGSAIARLSSEALEHAFDLATSEPGALTSALYCYNRIPLTRFWLQRWAGRDEVLAEIGATGTLKSFLDRFWTLLPAESSPSWISWQSRSAAPRRRHEPAGVTWKLYVSPRPEHIGEAFAALVRVLAEIPGAQMKIGRDAAGLLRPDKLVSYFPNKGDLERAASALAPQLRGIPSHGVPFTAGIDEDGVLSWGVDPPESARALSWLGRESWRLWIATRLGAALAFAKSGEPVDPATDDGMDLAVAFATERVRRHDVDVQTWTPGPSLWRDLA